jgi:cellulose synthase (UDP-forming)
VVDYVGLSILGDAVWDSLSALPPQSFDQLMADRYQRVKPLNKPIIIAELGVSGTPARQAAWLSDAVRNLAAYPLVRAVVYFDAVNASNNRQAVQPDWRLDPTLLSDFADQLRGVGFVMGLPDSPRQVRSSPIGIVAN